MNLLVSKVITWHTSVVSGRNKNDTLTNHHTVKMPIILVQVNMNNAKDLRKNLI